MKGLFQCPQRVKGGDLKSPPLINQGGVSPQWYNQL